MDMFFWRLMVEILSSANGYWWRKCSFVFKIVTLNYLAQIQDIHDTITILSAACKHQPSCSADATRDTHHFFPGVGSSCWILQKLSSSQFFWGDGCLPYESLGEVHFHYAAPILNNLSRMWFGHQYLWAQNLFSDVQMRGMDVCPFATEDSGVRGEANHQVDGFCMFLLFLFFFEFRWNLEVIQNRWTPSYFPCFWKIHQLGWGSCTFLRHISICKPDLQTWSNRKFTVLDLHRFSILVQAWKKGWYGLFHHFTNRGWKNIWKGLCLPNIFLARRDALVEFFHTFGTAILIFGTFSQKGILSFYGW